MPNLYIKNSTIAKNTPRNAVITANVPTGAKFPILAVGEREASHTRITIAGTIKGRNTWWFYDGHCSYAEPGVTSDEGTIKPGEFRVNSIARKLIRYFEGMELKAYTCPAGIATIGIGSTQWFDRGDIPMGATISEEQAWQLFDRDCQRFIEAINHLVETKLTGKQCAALLSWTFNCGEDALEESTLLKVINSGGSYEAIGEQLRRWTKAGSIELAGLVRRRDAEARLWKGESIDSVLANV